MADLLQEQRETGFLLTTWEKEGGGCETEEEEIILFINLFSILDVKLTLAANKNNLLLCTLIKD